MFVISLPFNVLPETPKLPAEIATFKCYVCPDSYYRQGDWNSHEKLAHTFKCDNCDKIEIIEKDLAKHMVDVHGIKLIIHTMQFVCDQCFITATLNRAFKFHMKKHHPIPYVGELCEFTSSELALLKQHVDTPHMNQKLELNLN